MINIFDCSNSAERPSHRGGGGPVVNDVMQYLHESCYKHDCAFVENWSEADVIITNDVFPQYVLGLRKPLVKRMDGVFWHSSLIGRNTSLNFAATCADKVIFISDYSRDSYFNLYGDSLKSYCVVHHWVNPRTFHLDPVAFKEKIDQERKFVFAASATDWSRIEKRYSDLLLFANTFPVHILLIGKTDFSTPNNITKVGYLTKQEDIAVVLNKADGFLNLTYRDAATKTIPQAISCGLPVLYADSGGVSEMVGQYGVGIPEEDDIAFSTSIPHLTQSQLEKGFKEYKDKYQGILDQLKSFDPNTKFKEMLVGYFEAIKSVL